MNSDLNPQFTAKAESGSEKIIQIHNTARKIDRRTDRRTDGRANGQKSMISVLPGRRLKNSINTGKFSPKIITPYQLPTFHCTF
jgi:hypothetical protein